DHSMNLAGQTASRSAHGLSLIASDAGTVLMHADNRRVDHLHGCIVRSGQCVHDPAPDASPPPANETIVAGGMGAEAIRQIAPGCPGSQNPEDAIEDATVVRPRDAARLVRQHRLDGSPLIVGEFVAHDSSPRFWGLESRLESRSQRALP